MLECPHAPSYGAHPKTILFTDIVEFSNFNERVGDRVASQIVNQILSTQSEIIDSNEDGKVVEMKGDGNEQSFRDSTRN